MSELIIGKSHFIENRITSNVSANDELMKYVFKDNLFLEYDTKVYTDNSILTIPLTATILPLAWLTGSDVRVDSLDKTFKESMDDLQLIFKEIHPDIPFTTEIRAEKLVKNKLQADKHDERTGLLFSGGVDSTYSMIKNLESKPRLIMIWGVDNFPYPENSIQWNHIYSTYKEQANRLGLQIHLIKTNISRVLNHRRINHDFYKMLHGGSVGALLQHSLPLLTSTAPLSFGRFDKLLIAASSGTSYDFEKFPWGSSPEVDEKILWADLEVIHDGAIDRHMKIIDTIKEFHMQEPLQLRVCLRKLNKAMLNDSTCEKCLRTIVPLTMIGVDPNTFGFKLDENSFKILKKMITRGELSPVLVEGHWIPIKKSIPDNMTYDQNGSREFLQWLKQYDLYSTHKNMELYRKIYFSLPYYLAKNLDKLYMKMGLHIHEGSPRRKGS